MLTALLWMLIFFAFALSDQFMTSLTVDYGGVGYKIGVSAIRGSCRD